MNDSQPANPEPPHRSWLGRIGKALTGSDGPRNREELLGSLREAQQRGLIDAEALVMLEGVLEVNEMQVRDVMIPRSQMVVVQRDATLEELLPILAESQHSRFPVIGESKDEVLGIMLAKDLLPYFASGRKRSSTSATFCARRCSFPRASVSTCCSRSSVPAAITSPWWWTSTAASTAW